VLADPGQIGQVILNLVVNARDAMPAGGRITVEAGAETISGADREVLEVPPGPVVRLAVSDTGFGMSAEVRSHLFEPFFTTKAAGKGTGLGLAIVYGIVKQAGGDVRVGSAPGRGACFEVFLPAAAPESTGPEPAAAREQIEPGDETILLVEDEPRVRAVQAAALRRAGYTVLEAADGETALGLAVQSGRIDVVVTDLVMPRLGGAALAAKLRKLRGPVPVVFVSGYAGEGLAAALPGDAEAAILQKPFSAAALTRIIRERLAARPRPAPPLTPGTRG
jgi:CheY-like chemotaxis protein